MLEDRSVQVIGTAGHVDHGKSALVKALSGIDPDRLKEEKEREMTIDLGFAWLSTPGGHVASIVDVPGHEDFIKNMLAGVGGIDMALLVVAADEGIMPQTQEHLAILDLLNVKRGVVALTKTDLIADAEWLALVQEELAEELQGTSLAGAAIVPVSALTGEGIPALLAEIDRLLATSEPRRDVGRPRLPIDRAFTISGFGTIVTGTLTDGQFQVGQDVEIQPGGLRSRIRGLQTHKHKTERAVPGSRVAINLVGLGVEDLRRGQVVTIPGWLRGTVLLDARLRLLSAVPKPLAHNAAVDFFSGAAQVQARVRVLAQDRLNPGDTGWVQLRLDRPVAVARGDRFIIRQPSPSMTIGGGVIVSAHPGRRYRRFRPEVLHRLEVMARGDPSQLVLEVLDISSPLTIAELAERTSLPDAELEEALHQLQRTEEIMFLADSIPSFRNRLDASLLVASRSGWERLVERLAGLLGEYHRQQPLRLGMPREELKSRLRLTPRQFAEVTKRALAEGRIRKAGMAVCLPDHRVAFSRDQQGRIQVLEADFKAHPYAPPSVKQAEEAVGPDVLAALVEEGRFTRLTDSVLFESQVLREMISRVVEHLQAGNSITVAQVRDMFGTSRKYALALLEYMDQERITRRVGDERVLR